MHSIMKTITSAAALIATIQLVPAPFLGGIAAAVGADLGSIGEAVGTAAGVAGAVEGGISAGNGKVKRSNSFTRVKRADYGTQQAWDDCHNQLSGSDITFSAPNPGTVLVSGIPSACMTLSTVITGKFDEGDPIPEGSDSIKFTNLSNEDIQTIQNALNAHS